MYRTDILIIGSGVIGLAAANELSAISKNIVVVEKNKSFGRETSSRNSEVIHSGIYYPQDTLKARMCVRGRGLLYRFCIENSVPYKKTGKLIVAADREEVGGIESLFTNAGNNGVPGLRIMDREEMRRMEPAIGGVAALYSPETGILDSHIFMQSLFAKAKDAGVDFVFDSEAAGIKKQNDGYRVTIKDRSGDTDLSAKVVVNCAGLDSDLVAEMAGIDIKANKYELHYCKGQYFRVNQKKARFISRLVYPVPAPSAGGLGIHATLDLGGGLRLGPDHEYPENRVKDYSVDGSKRTGFYRSIKRLLPFIEEADIFPDTAGIRPKLKAYGSDFRDFVINEEAGSGFPGFINLIGIESPGLTAALAIAEYVRQMASAHLLLMDKGIGGKV